jgi:hypothetical protein
VRFQKPKYCYIAVEGYAHCNSVKYSSKPIHFSPPQTKICIPYAQ